MKLDNLLTVEPSMTTRWIRFIDKIIDKATLSTFQGHIWSKLCKWDILAHVDNPSDQYRGIAPQNNWNKDNDMMQENVRRMFTVDGMTRKITLLIINISKPNVLNYLKLYQKG